MSTLGELIKGLRGKESLRDAAKRIGVSHTYLSILEKGYDLRTKNPINPTADTLKLIAKAYDFPYEELLKVAGIIDEDLRNEITINEKMKLIEQIDSLPEHERKLVEGLINSLINKNK